VTLPAREKTKIKICGITTVADSLLAAQAGADYIGILVGVSFSPRQISVDVARLICEQSTLPVVILVFNWEAAAIKRLVQKLHPHAVQLLGQESVSLVKSLKKMVACELWKTIHLPPRGHGETNIAAYVDNVNSLFAAGINAVLIDTVVGAPEEGWRYGGTGRVNDWDLARKLVAATAVPAFLAGGINPENIRQAIETVRPCGIDLCSGVEITTGKKDPEKLRRLIQAAHGTTSESNCGTKAGSK
jgi:phosphoribosylanthranilate isomerase